MGGGRRGESEAKIKKLVTKNKNKPE